MDNQPLSVSEEAAAELDRLFRNRLCSLVEREMNRRYARREDAEDVVQSVFRTFFRRAANGEFQCEHDGALWNLLKKITRRKILKHVEYHEAKARTPGKEERIANQELPEIDIHPRQAQLLGDALEHVLGGVKPLEHEILRLQLFGYTIAEVVEIVLNGLKPEYIEILQLRLQGYSKREIGEKVGCGQQAVRTRLDRLQERLARLLADSTDS